jgi:hypothetical protein
MSKKTNNNEVPNRVGMRSPFVTTNGTLMGVLDPAKQDYIVYSYGDHWPLAMYEHLTGTWYVNVSKCSRTTSKHATIVRRGISGATTPLNTTDMLAVVRHGSVGLVMESNEAIKVQEFEDVPF